MLNDDHTLVAYDELINGPIQLTRYVSEETVNFFKQGRQNFNWENEIAEIIPNK